MTIPLKVSNIGSGVNYINFTLSDITVTIGKNGISDIAHKNDVKGNFKLIVSTYTYNGEVVITIFKNSVYNNVVNEIKNGNNKTILKSGFKFDNTALTCSISLTTYHKVQN